ncbi:MAG: hypothetical protein K0Q54_5247 [Methylobacterium brachiatum]|jgi:hypothetical protein|nr:hypothetical protein [Methylobacterium brachiatum]
MSERAWHSMSTAPRDRRIDLQAERWVAGRECLRVEVFTRCKWCDGGTARNPGTYWRALPRGWTPTHWREVQVTAGDAVGSVPATPTGT